MIIYLVKSTLLLFLLLAVYKLLLEREKMHQFNRFFLLFALVFGLTAPLITFDLSPGTEVAGIELRKVEQIVEAPAEIITKTIAPKAIPQAESPEVKSLNKYPSLSISKEGFFLGVYGLITFLLFIRFGFGLFQIRSTIRSGEVSTFKHAKLVLVEEAITPQSFLKHIFLNKDEFKSGKVGEEILLHEHTHVSQLHSLDVLFIELLKVPFWFNPILYFYKHAIQLNHEFIADSFVIQKSPSVKSYQEKLIKACTSIGSASIMTSKFNQSNVETRLKIMGKSSSLLAKLSRSILLVPVVLASALLFCTKTEPVYGFKVLDNRNLGHPIEAIGTNGTLYHSDTILKIKVIAQTDSAGVTKPLGDGLIYSEDENLFTGTQQFSLEHSDIVAFEFMFEKGLRTGYRYFDEGGSLVQRGEIIYENGNRVFTAGFDGSGVEIYRVEQIFDGNTRLSMRMYSDGKITHEVVDPSVENSFSGTYKEFYENGQLKFEMPATNSMEYNGLMTLYDEQGQILEQELYKNNELVEKIK
ncbi:MAG: M56 family metallopeptidase [Balneolaceae bacterium]